MKTGKNAAEFHDEDDPEVGSTYICLPVISVETILKKVGVYYPQNVNM